jgi:hypothetical protein
MIMRILNFFKRLWSVANQFLQEAFEKGKVFAPLAISFTDQIKFYVEHPIMDVVVDLIPGEWDNKALDKLRKVNKEVAEKLLTIAGVVVESENVNQLYAELVKCIQDLKPELRANFYILLSAELNKALSDGKLTIAESIIATQAAFYESRKK